MEYKDLFNLNMELADGKNLIGSIWKTIRDIMQLFSLQLQPTSSNKNTVSNDQSCDQQKRDLNQLEIPTESCQPLQLDIDTILSDSTELSKPMDTPNFI